MEGGDAGGRVLLALAMLDGATGAESAVMFVDGADGRMALLLLVTALVEGVVLEMVILGAPEVRVGPAATAAFSVEVRVADGVVVPLVTTSDSVVEDVVPEVVVVAALEASVWSDGTGEEVVADGWEDGGIVLLLTLRLSGCSRLGVVESALAIEGCSARMGIEAAMRTLCVSHASSKVVDYVGGPYNPEAERQPIGPARLRLAELLVTWQEGQNSKSAMLDVWITRKCMAIRENLDHIGKGQIMKVERAAQPREYSPWSNDCGASRVW